MQYRPIIDAMSGVLFLGAPHFRDRLDAKRAFDLLLKCQHKGFGRTLSTDRDILSLMQVCKDFELVNIQVPIISVYESLATSLRRSLFQIRAKARDQVVRCLRFGAYMDTMLTTPCYWKIVPQELGTLGFGSETVVDGEADHFDICKVPDDSKLDGRLRSFFTTIMSTAPQRIADATQPCEYGLNLVYYSG